MVGGGKKDATYIASLFEPYLEVFEATCPTSVDYLSFDGAGNVQLAGRILQAKFPRIIVTHSAEHVILLYFQDCFSKLSILSAFQNLQGSWQGASHAIWLFRLGFFKNQERTWDGQMPPHNILL